MKLQQELLADPAMMADHPVGICEPEKNWDQSKPLMVILAACHGRNVVDYFNMKPAFRSLYNIVRLETAPIMLREMKGEDVMTRPSMRRLFQETDVLLTYNMGASHGSFSLERVRVMLRPDCRVVTFAAPNCSLFWPVSHGYCGILPVMHALDQGKSVEQICADFDAGQFDPLFKLRWRLEMGRIEHRDTTHDVKLGTFITQYHKTYKLFAAISHPTFTTIAWLGAGIMKVLGHASDDAAAVVAYNYAHQEISGYPETKYEFEHYGFTYPMRHQTTALGGYDHYHKMIRDSAAFSQSGGHCSLPLD